MHTDLALLKVVPSNLPLAPLNNLSWAPEPPVNSVFSIVNWLESITLTKASLWLEQSSNRVFLMTTEELDVVIAAPSKVLPRMLLKVELTM